MTVTVRISEITNKEVVQQYVVRVGGIIPCYDRLNIYSIPIKAPRN